MCIIHMPLQILNQENKMSAYPRKELEEMVDRWLDANKKSEQ